MRTRKWLDAGREVVDDLVAVALPVGVFWAASFLLELTDWGLGPARAAGLLLAVLAVPRLRPLRVHDRRTVTALLAVVTLVLVAFHVLGGLRAMAEDRPLGTDIGQTTVAAVQVEEQGSNPYVEYLDAMGRQVAPDGDGWRWFGGYKYGPAMTATYRTAVLEAGVDGYHLVNLLALGVTAAATGLWAGRRPRGDATVAWGAAALVLAVSFVGRSLWLDGVNDLVPVALVTVAFAVRGRGPGGDAAAGVAWGCSVAAKLLPGGLLLLPLLVRGGRRWLVAAVGAGTVALWWVPELLAAPQAFIANLFLFNLARGGDDTAATFGMPAPVPAVVSLVAAAVSLALLVRWACRAAPRRLDAATVSFMALALLLAGGQHLHRNYLLWLAPLAAVAVARRVWAPADHRVPGTTSRGARLARR